MGWGGPARSTNESQSLCKYKSNGIEVSIKVLGVSRGGGADLTEGGEGEQRVRESLKTEDTRPTGKKPVPNGAD